MSTTPEAAFKQIETWDRKVIKQILAEAAGSPELEKSLKERYQPLIDFVEGKDLQVLTSLPKKITARKHMKKAWEPDETSIGIMAAIPAEEIDLSKMKVFPEWILHLRKLKSLSLTESRLQELPDLSGFVELEKLSLSRNRLKRLPGWLCDLPLKELKVSFNELEGVPESIGKMSRLEMLDLSYNKLTEIPDSLGQCEALIRLKLGGNQLTCLPDSLSALTELAQIFISSNKFTELPGVIAAFRNLIVLEFSFNEIGTLPAWIGSLAKLQVLDLEKTKVPDLPRELLGLEMLRSLDIRSTPFQEGKGFSSSIKKEEIRDFLTRHFSDEKDPVVDLYEDLESREPARIYEALKSLAASPELKERAEKRYLGFIRARLNDPEASLDDFPRAMLSPEEEELLLKGKFGKILGDGFLSFQYLDGKDSKLVVDFAGGMVSPLIDIEAYMEGARKCGDLYDLMNHADESAASIKRAIQLESQIYGEGWFGRIYAAFATLEISRVLFDHTQFYDANASLVMREFYLFLAGRPILNNFTMDIFQSDPPELTEMFWMLQSVPETIWGDVEVDLPGSTLSFTRQAKVKAGDFSDWVKMESVPAEDA